jgi:hypothetical protein
MENGELNAGDERLALYMLPVLGQETLCGLLGFPRSVLLVVITVA